MSADVEKVKALAYELGKKNELERTGCGQSALAAVLEAVGRPNEEVFRAASGLADGLGLSTKGTCGALLGAAMAIGLFFGRGYDKFDDPMAAMDSYDLVLEVVEEFEKQVGASEMRRHSDFVLRTHLQPAPARGTGGSRRPGAASPLCGSGWSGCVTGGRHHCRRNVTRRTHGSVRHPGMAG